MRLFNFFRQELAIDLGTANTLIIQDGKIVVDEPSIVAIDRRSGQTIAVGRRAMMMHEKTHEDIRVSSVTSLSASPVMNSPAISSAI